ncbi:hypothetical protein [Halalkalicoccus tibetensis]|uniref:Uncharacterized protein n=1 Tax=Halalkalicoccus tibetensis TaxID=175632 RepID=A0ABD5V1P1_9EURY
MDRETKWGIGFVVIGLGALILLSLDESLLSPPGSDAVNPRRTDRIGVLGALALTELGAYTLVSSD